jgi:hypothetical protein
VQADLENEVEAARATLELPDHSRVAVSFSQI